MAEAGDFNDGNECDLNNIYAVCFQERDRFIEIANQYLLNAGKETLDLNTKDSWRDVEVSMEQACQTLERMTVSDKSVEGFVGKLRKAYRLLCDNSGTVTCLIDQIPTDFLLAPVLRGGLRVIFLALENAGYHRQSVYTAIEELPLILSDKAAHLDIFVSDKELHRRVAALYKAYLSVLRHIIKWFLRSNFKTGIKNILQPTAAKEKLKEKMAQVKVRAEEFKERALVCSQIRQSEALEMQREMLDLQKEGVDLQSKGLNVQNLVQQDVQKILNQLQDVKAQLDSLARLRNIATNFQSYTMLSKTKPPPDIESTDLPSTSATSNFLKTLQYEPWIVRHDCRVLARSHTDRKDLDINRVSAIMANVQFQAWLKVDSSGALLINGGVAALRAKSETSFVSARLFSYLTTTFKAPGPRTLCVSYYCGQHQNLLSDVYASPSEMMMSLLLQLVDNWGHFDPGDLDGCFQKIRPDDSSSVCAVFEALIRRLPREIVLFIIIDGVNYFSDPEDRASETREIVSKLLFIQGNPPKARVKYLFAGPCRSKFIEASFEEKEIMNIPQSCPPTGSSLLAPELSYDRRLENRC